MKQFKQTWWDENLGNKFNEFESWIGPSTEASKVYFRQYIKDKGYKTLIDLGCGTATEYFAYSAEYPELSYLGIDSSTILYNRNTELGVPMLLVGSYPTPLVDNHSDVVFSRHVLEHQPSFELLLSEMIRLASKEAIHVFFIAPKDREVIYYNPEENLYHNTFNKGEIESFLIENKDVESFSWIPINTGEIALSVIKKAS